MRIIRAADCRVQPWKNGGGTTTEIAVSPADAGLDTFDWRVSVARIERSGPFSSFPGIDRSFAVLAGDGLLLGVDGRDPVRLEPSSAAQTFRGDATTHATLPGGPTVDFNVMTRRGRWRHLLSRVGLKGPVRIARVGDVTLVLVHGCAAEAARGEQWLALADGDALMLEAEDVIAPDLKPVGNGEALIVDLWQNADVPPLGAGSARAQRPDGLHADLFRQPRLQG